VTNDDRSRACTSSFRPSPDSVYSRIGEESVLVNMRTNRIYELNRTGTRFWELLSAGYTQAEIEQLMLQEFGVAEDDLAVEIKAMLASLQDEGLVTAYE
jgi:hypothetical protein